MDHHAELLASWREKSKNFTFKSEDNRLALMKYLLKFSDISNPARPKVMDFKIYWKSHKSVLFCKFSVNNFLFCIQQQHAIFDVRFYQFVTTV